ncbi:hypothetical protein ACJIZ3_013608 [Penstemon smallii]|uniref:WPP domain-containing protein n=1 Tax=Penstemon smallii TaxID=265156 RepID=A0ABD3RU73_9LAMI
MAETEPSPPPSATTVDATKHLKASFSIWPPSDRTRDAVRNRLIETLSSPSIISKRYGIVSPEEAVEAANLIEEEAFDAAGKAASTEDDGLEILQVYSKEISKRMLDTVKSRSGDSTATAPPVNETAVKATEEEEDAGSSAPPQSEKTESVADDE